MAPADDSVTQSLRAIEIENGVVTRPASTWTPTVHAFLRHLRSQGLACVPKPLGIEGDVERLAVIEGDAGGGGWKHQHADDGLRSAARLLRTVHDASIGWDPPDGAVFRAAHISSESEPSVWCHGDFGPWNVVWRDGEAVGLIDWDFLHQAPRLDDVSYALQWFAPTRDDEMALTWHHFPSVPDRAARIRTFLDAYGEGLPDFDVAETVATRMEATMALELSLADEGFEPQRTWVEEGSQEWAAGEVRWVRDNADLLRLGQARTTSSRHQRAADERQD